MDCTFKGRSLILFIFWVKYENFYTKISNSSLINEENEKITKLEYKVIKTKLSNSMNENFFKRNKIIFDNKFFF